MSEFDKFISGVPMPPNPAIADMMRRIAHIGWLRAESNFLKLSHQLFQSGQITIVGMKAILESCEAPEE